MQEVIGSILPLSTFFFLFLYPLDTLNQSGFEEEIVGDTFERFNTLLTEEIEAYNIQKPKLSLHKSHLLGNQVVSTHPIPPSKPAQVFFPRFFSLISS